MMMTSIGATMTNNASKDIHITCADQCKLAASIFHPKGELKGAVMIGPATGIKRQFYGNFARYLAEHGYGVITFDNRGIGGSLHGHVKQSDVTLQCWGEKDMPAVLQQLQQSFPDCRYHLIGHSAGGQLVGLMPNANELSSMFNFASSSGCLRNMKLHHQVKAHFFMNFFIPVTNRLFGYTKSHWVGMGEPLPKKVAKQWQTWCNGSGYVKMAFGSSVHKHLYHHLELPAMWLNATDDFIANDKNVADMLKVFTQMSAQTKTLNARDYNLSEIGHMKFFSQKSKQLWPYATKWLDEH